MANNWKEIWQNRNCPVNGLNVDDRKETFLELKRIDGFDMKSDNGLTYESLMDQHKSIMDGLSKYNKIESVFDLGCGSGANMFILQQDGYAVGGIDYSDTLLDIAKKVLKPKGLLELVCDSASNMPTDIQYDAILSNSVFSYFSDYEYAEKVLDNINKKVRYSFALIDLHDLEKKDAFLDYRRKLNPNYDRDYQNLSKLFYGREFFENWADRNGFDVVFTRSEMEGYWNNEYLFNAFFYRK